MVKSSSTSAPNSEAHQRRCASLYGRLGAAGRLATLADYAALAFEPFSQETLEAIKPPDSKEWALLAKNLRVAHVMLSRTKEEMTDAARRLGDQEGEKISYSFDCTIELLRAYADAIESADIRLLSAFASLGEAADA
jgi:hypothetical protein